MEHIFSAGKICIADCAADTVIQHCLPAVKALQIIAHPQIARTGIGECGKVHSNTLGFTGDRQRQGVLVYRVVHPDAIDNDLGQRGIHSPEGKDADTAAGRQVDPPVRRQIMPRIGVQRACQSIIGTVRDCQSVLARQKLCLVHCQNTVILQKPQLAVPVIEIKDAACVLLEVLRFFKSAVLPVVQAASGADKVPAAAGVLQNTQHDTLVQPLVEAVIFDPAVPDGIDAAAVAADQQSAI